MLAPVGCGCDLAFRALTTVDATERAVLSDDAPLVQCGWRCPRIGLVPAEARAELDERRRVVLADVDALLDGADCGTTCPKAVSRDPVAQLVMSAYAWKKDGQLRERLGAAPSLALCEAIDAIEQGVTARLEWERRNPERKSEREDFDTTE